MTAAGWANPVTAAEYERFAVDHPMYRRTSSDLIDRLPLAGDERVLDLCCGTGVTTRALLERLGPEGSVVAVDGSAAMLERARAAETDGRVTWVEGRAESLTELVEGPVDAVVCNSAIWQTDMSATFSAVAGVLRLGGRFVCNIGRTFLIMPFTEDELRRSTPGLIEIMNAYAVIDLLYAAPFGARRGGPPLTPDSVNEALAAAGLEAAAPEVVVYDQTVNEQAAWLRIPIFTERTFPGLDHATRMALLDKAVARVGEPSVVEQVRWVIFQAAKP